MRTSQPGPPGRATAPWRRWLLPAAFAAGLLTLLALPHGAAPGTALSYTRFLADVGAGTVRTVAIGPVSYPGPPAGHPALAQRGYSEHTQWLLDQEVAAILTQAETRARDLLTTHRGALDQLTAALLEQETVTGDQVRALAQAEITTASEPAVSTNRISR